MSNYSRSYTFSRNFTTGEREYAWTSVLLQNKRSATEMRPAAERHPFLPRTPDIVLQNAVGILYQNAVWPVTER